MTSVTAIKKECLECPCFKVKGCSECDELVIGGMGVEDHRPGCAGQYPRTCNPEDCVAAKDDLLNLQTNAAVAEILQEWKKIFEELPPIRNRHEVYGRLASCLVALLFTVGDPEASETIADLRATLTTTAAMALRSILDLCPPDVTDGLEDVMGLEAGSLAGKGEEGAGNDVEADTKEAPSDEPSS